MWSRRARFLVEKLDLPAAAQIDNAKWERFQLAHLCDDTTLRLEVKSRQIAWSFTVAAEAVANAMLEGESTIFVSINQDEAIEKIRYAKLVYQNLQVGGLPSLTRDNELGIEFSNGARLTSLPSRPPRGKARMNIVLDEFAHIQRDREVYAGALPIITKGGRLRVGSSPMGAGGMFWEIAREELRAYPGFTRVQTPWWECQAFCRRSQLPPLVGEVTTEQRVEQYGSERIRAIFENMPAEDFEQEYCCAFVDESISWIPWAIIKRNQDPNLLCWHAKGVDQALVMLEEMRQAVYDKHAIETVFVGGLDIGRKKNLTELTLLGMGAVYPIRFMVSLDRVEFVDQETCIRQILDVLPIKGLLIDENGLGMQLAENLSRGTCAEGVTFTNASKEMWAVRTKIELEQGHVPIPVDRDLSQQIHSIKKKVTAAKNNVFDTEANEKHHADRFWSLALAIWAAKGSGGGLHRGTISVRGR